MELSEKQLVADVKSGDTRSFEVLYEHYGKRIYLLALRMCGNIEDAEDIVQRTFITAFDNISTFREESGIYTWLYIIAKNLCLRLLENRKKSTFASLDDLIHTAVSQENVQNFPDNEKQYYISQVKEGCLLGLLRCLPFYQRISFILNVLLEVKARDVAQITSKSETATRVLVYRAKQNLKRFLCQN